MIVRCLTVLLVWHVPLLAQVQQQQQIQPQGGLNQNLNQPDAGILYSGTGTNPYYGVNLVPFGPEVGDSTVNPALLTSGQTIDLYMFFPFYGGLYNYTSISGNGYIAFATVLDQGQTINIGPENTDWPRKEDPAMIAPYLCKQQIPQNPSPGMRANVYYRLMMRQSLFGRGSNNNMNLGSAYQPSSFLNQNAQQACQNTPDSYVRCDSRSDYFLDEMQMWLQDGVAGATAFRADAALVVTWYNTASAIAGRSDIDAGQLSTYQLIWLTDETARLSYVILNYDKLGFDASDFRLNSRTGRCQAVFNGGNHTGYVPVDPTQPYKNSPKVLAQRSGVPHWVRGRYMFRVDDIVRPGGCSNKTGGTYPMLIYPNIVNMLGEMTVDINAICLDPSQTYVLMIEQRQTATCQVINPAIARCNLPKIFDWGTKTVYFQPQSGGANDEKAFVGYIYFVPPTLDPMRLDIGNIYDWFKNPMPYSVMPITWYPRNFTNPDLTMVGRSVHLGDDQIYSVQLGLYVIAYREYKDDGIKKFRPEHRVICRLATYSNRNTYEYRYKAQEERINVYQVEQWYMNDWQRQHELFNYRFGYLKLAPIKPDTGAQFQAPQLLSGLVSAPISLHWLWTTDNPEFRGTTYQQGDEDQRVQFVKKKSTEMCHDWYDEDGAMWNFIRDVETNSSCPCKETQAYTDLGRFMPHPRCSQAFRDITCTVAIGARNCYMSAQNVLTSESGRHGESISSSRFPTHYGQVCCYDDQGFLMQTSYQPVIKVTPEVPYNPGFPMRAYEFGTTPYMGQFEVPGLSAFQNDYMPYFFCCKFADFRCQMFYWRRPSSGCQEYQPPAFGEGMGAGTFNTIDNDKFIFNEPGVYNALYIPHTSHSPEVKVQIRMERYPNRRVDFGYLGRYFSQEDLVQPTNATVITGVAMEATGTDRVHVLARKDTRRFRYRTSIIVGNIMRYFDTMRIQRFKGVLIYVNNVERGQPEIYVVLEEAQIGVRVRESYALDIDRLPNYQESMGMLNVAISVPPQYGVRPDGDKTRETEMRTRYNLPRVAGLYRPFPDQTSNSYYTTLTLNDVNSEQYRQQIINLYRVQGSGETGSDQNLGSPGIVGGMPTVNLFTTSRDEDKKFEVFPEATMKSGPIYQTAPKYQTGVYRFYPVTGTALNQELMNCRDLQTQPILNLQPMQSQITQQYGINQCPDNPGAIISECGDSIPCQYDYTLLNAKVLGLQAKQEWNVFTSDRMLAMQRYNSCGPINIEYPEYLMKTSSMHSAYLENDVARFECFQSHWIKGTHEYTCQKVLTRNRDQIYDEYSYRVEWNKGEQPWCRSRQKENFFIWLAAIFGFIGVILVIIMIFLCCWCVKNRKRNEQLEKMPISEPPSRGDSFKKLPPSYETEPLNDEKPRYAEMQPRGDFTPLSRNDKIPFPSETSTPDTVKSPQNLHGYQSSV